MGDKSVLRIKPGSKLLRSAVTVWRQTGESGVKERKIGREMQRGESERFSEKKWIGKNKKAGGKEIDRNSEDEAKERERVSLRSTTYSQSVEKSLIKYQ